MKAYDTKQLVAISRYQNYFPSLPHGAPSAACAPTTGCAPSSPTIPRCRACTWSAPTTAPCTTAPYYDVPGFCYGLCIDSGYIAATEAVEYIK